MRHSALLRIVTRYLSPEASITLERLLRSTSDVDYVIGGRAAYFIIYYNRDNSCKPVMISREGTLVELSYLAIATRRSMIRGIRVFECTNRELYRYIIQYSVWDLCDKPSYTGTVYTRDFKLCLSEDVPPVRHWRG